MKWLVEKSDDPNNDGFPEWVTFSDDEDKWFKTGTEARAQWLCDQLNANDS